MPKFKPNKEEQKQVNYPKNTWRDMSEKGMRDADKRASDTGLPPTLVGRYSEHDLRTAESHIKAINEGRMGVPDNNNKKKSK